MLARRTPFELLRQEEMDSTVWRKSPTGKSFTDCFVWTRALKRLGNSCTSHTSQMESPPCERALLISTSKKWPPSSKASTSKSMPVS
eukprot:22856_6